MGLDLWHVRPSLRTSRAVDYFRVDEFRSFPEFIDRNKHLIDEVTEEDNIIIKVFYCEEVGYQRKGMKQQFYEDFNDCQVYLRKEDVLKAFRYLDIGDKHRPTLEKDFKESFIDNFIEGESFFFASW